MLEPILRGRLERLLTTLTRNVHLVRLLWTQANNNNNQPQRGGLRRVIIPQHVVAEYLTDDFMVPIYIGSHEVTSISTGFYTAFDVLTTVCQVLNDEGKRCVLDDLVLMVDGQIKLVHITREFYVDDTTRIAVTGRMLGGSEDSARHSINTTQNSDAPAAMATGSNGATSTGTTTFVDNETTVKGQARTNLGIKDLGPPQFDSNSIKEFMAKPYLIWQGNITNVTYGTTIYSTQVSDRLLANPLWTNKIQGYNLFRGTACFRLQVNATPFQQGKLIMHFLPNIRADMSTTARNIEAALHTTTLLAATQHPNVELDYRDTSAEFRVPYITPVSYFDMTSQKYDWGKLYIDVLAVLKYGAAGSTAVSASLFMWFEDVELSAPYYQAQSARGSHPSVKDFSNKLKIGKTQDNEKKESNNGWLSKTANSGKVVADALTNVPVIGEIAGIASGVLGAVGSVASWFGFSRPVNLDKIQHVTQHPFRFSHNAVGYNDSDVLALNPDAHQSMLVDFAGARADEMSFNFLKKIPVYVGGFAINTTDVEDTLLYSTEISPKYQRNAAVIAGATSVVTVHAYGPMGYLSNMMKCWRGGITYTFKFIKTEFHSCRLLFIFSPLLYTGGTSINTDESNYCLREIVDIRTDSEVSITMPWLINLEWLDTSLDPTSINKSGTLYVRVLNKLVAPETCSQSMDVQVYISAADDFDLAVPVPNNFQPPVMAQGDFGDDMIGNSQSSGLSNIHNITTIGDTFTSIKQLLNVLTPVFTTVALTGDMIYYPSYVGVSAITAATDLVMTGPMLGGDYFANLSLGYYLSRGGVRFAIPTTSSSTLQDRTSAAMMLSYRETDPFIGAGSQVYTNPSSFLYQPAGAFNPAIPYATACGINTISSNDKAIIDVVMPQYSLTPVRQNIPRVPNGGLAIGSLPVDQSSCVLKVQTTAHQHTIYRAGADDYCLGYFIGFPTVIFSVVPV